MQVLPCPLAPPAPADAHCDMHCDIDDAALASRRHVSSFWHPCVQRATGSVDDELEEDPHPSTAATPSPTTKMNFTADLIAVFCITLLMVVVRKARP